MPAVRADALGGAVKFVPVLVRCIVPVEASGCHGESVQGGGQVVVVEGAFRACLYEIGRRVSGLEIGVGSVCHLTDGGAVGEFGDTEVLLHPALVADLDGAVGIAVCIVHLGSAATEGGVVVVAAIVGLDVGKHVLEAVDAVVERAQTVVDHRLHVGCGDRRDVDGLVIARVGGEGAHGLTVLHDGEYAVARCRRIVACVACVALFCCIADAADRDSFKTCLCIDHIFGLSCSNMQCVGKIVTKGTISGSIVITVGGPGLRHFSNIMLGEVYMAAALSKVACRDKIESCSVVVFGLITRRAICLAGIPSRLCCQSLSCVGTAQVAFHAAYVGEKLFYFSLAWHMPAHRTEVVCEQTFVKVRGVHISSSGFNPSTANCGRPVVVQTASVNVLVVVLVIYRSDDAGVGGVVRNGRAVVEMCGSQILLGPALGADFDGVILVAVVVGDRGGAADEVDVSQSVQRVLHIGHHILKAVDPALEVVAA